MVTRNCRSIVNLHLVVHIKLYIKRAPAETYRTVVLYGSGIELMHREPTSSAFRMLHTDTWRYTRMRRSFSECFAKKQMPRSVSLTLFYAFQPTPTISRSVTFAKKTEKKKRKPCQGQGPPKTTREVKERRTPSRTLLQSLQVFGISKFPVLARHRRQSLTKGDQKMIKGVKTRTKFEISDKDGHRKKGGGNHCRQGRTHLLGMMDDHSPSPFPCLPPLPLLFFCYFFPSRASTPPAPNFAVPLSVRSASSGIVPRRVMETAKRERIIKNKQSNTSRAKKMAAKKEKNACRR